MKTSTYMKRFCFEPHYKWTERYAQLAPIKLVSALGIVAFQIYKNENQVFVILDVEPHVDLTSLKKHICNHNQNEKSVQALHQLLTIETTSHLERIFKMIPTDDALVVKQQNVKRTVMTLQLHADEKLLDAYKNVHKPENVWPEVIQNMQTVGVLDMELYLAGYQAFLVMDTPPSFNMEKDGKRWASLPREQEWQAHVAQFQKVNPKSNATEKWQTMTQIV